MMPPNQDSCPNGKITKSNRDVGITIALHHSRRFDIDVRDERQQPTQQPKQTSQPSQQRQHTEQQQQSTIIRTDLPVQTRTSPTETTSQSSKLRHPRERSCWNEFTLSLAIYVTCIILPTLYNMTSQFIQTLFSFLMKSSLVQRISLGGGEAAWTDLGIILVLSLTLAMGRIWLVQKLVDTASPQNVEAMLRCKSLHLLSSAYSQSLTPKATRKCKNIFTTLQNDHDISLQSLDNDKRQYSSAQLPTLPNLGDPKSESRLLTQYSSDCRNPESSNDSILEETRYSTSPITPRVLSHRMYPRDNVQEEITEEDSTYIKGKYQTLSKSPSWVESTWETVRRSSEQALLVLDHEEELNIHDEENDDKPSNTFPVRLNNRNNSIRLHAAPRYATAIFRCCYTTCSIATAWICFSSSNFWPPQVGGSWGKAGQGGGGGRTAHCWNLKGSPGMAEDFDGLDALLKFYYLLQASYHVHSGAFHILTMILLWNRRRLRQRQEQSNRQQSKLFLRSANSKRHGWASTKPFTSYGRSILQHGIALLLITGSHLFASTRRLGAIGSFVLDVSSWFLHALQVCINAPVPPLSPAAIQWVHHCIVIPVFVYCRFYIWPFVVWRSAMFESTDWLKHMESTMFPGIYQAMMWVFTALAAVLLGLNIILFQRLVHHPHLQRVFETQSTRQRHSKLSAT